MNWKSDFYSQSAQYALLVTILLAPVGCSQSNGLERYSVSGEVRYDGKPAPLGEIMFLPDRDAANPGPGSIVEYRDGKFNLQDKGVIGGAYRLRITGYDGIPVRMESGVDPGGRQIFPPYEMTYEFPKEDTTLVIDIPQRKSR
ncbi:hypothetical protein M4951_20340 [Blastopirellula sp. J2-11]|uniref:hypothetical protein n=1 Tax=Blastopirellula sp. J2-11 TaxID=2943192 RepID=UPI0021C9A869|nr:hypothetical protein [Blastopirellula sp. J2-11]UUO05711.1 hypothetical protein M4951_20340 [Blastopirellula sp. J2-11]